MDGFCKILRFYPFFNVCSFFVFLQVCVGDIEPVQPEKVNKDNEEPVEPSNESKIDVTGEENIKIIDNCM